MDEYFLPHTKKVRRDTSDRHADFAGESSSHLNKEQLHCSICREVFIHSFNSQCGHNVCQRCITQSWDMGQKYNCPLCNETFTKRPEIKSLVIPGQMADNLNKKTGSDKSQVLCDICTGVTQKAIKSCLNCGLSFCTSHLKPHTYVPKYKQHKLINAVKNMEKYRCQKHERPLELFCKDDQMCVCQFCTEAEHKNHNIIPLEEESGQKKSQLEKTQMELQRLIQERLKKIQKINHSVKLSKRNTEKKKSDSVEVFTALIHSIERSQTELLEMMEKKQNAVEEQAEGLIKELEQEIDELQRRDTELEQLSHTDDHLHLLQIYPSLCITPHTKNWTKIRINTELSVDTLTLSALSQLQEDLNVKLRKAVSTQLKRIQQYAVDVTLDPDTAHPCLILSDDGKQVTCGNTNQNLPDIPKRFSKYPIILGNQGFSSGRFYYEVQVSGKTMWELGVVRESVNRKGKIALSPQNSFWTVVLRNWNEYFARDDPSVSLTPREKPQKVGVFVDYEEGLVSFYDVEARSHIYSFTGQSFTEKLYPYFNPFETNGGKNSAPLIITPVLKTE